MSFFDFSTSSAILLANCSGFFLYSTPASTFAGDEQFGSANIEMTDNRIVSGVWMGNQRSSGLSPLISSSPGGCKIEMQTSPFS
mmetsp:Transcript_7607/g.28522  ORF Transcript_7607/g.28522 Transcript_7607/m.28522 type:complete len:84 (+) Transcript_7607:380-631(+)